MKKILVLILVYSALLTTGAADMFKFTLAQGGTDNLFQNFSPVTEYITTPGFYLDKDLGRFSLFAEGGFHFLSQNSALSNFSQDLGLDYILPAGEKSAFYFSITGRGTLYRKDYSDFNFLAVDLYAAFKSYLTPTSIVQANYSLENKTFQASGFDYFSHALVVSFDKYFSSRTTIKAELNWGMKHFLHPAWGIESDSSATSSTQQSGFGMGGPGYGGQGGPGNGRTSSYFPDTKPQEPTIQIFSLGGVIAQGLTDSIGLRIAGLKQWNVSGENPFTQIEEYYLVENPSFDRFAWAGWQFEGQFTALLPWNIQVKLGYTGSDKTFPGIESLNLDGLGLGQMRKDNRSLWRADLVKNFPSLSIYLSYQLILNRSNDPYYDWTGNFLSAGIEWNYFFGAKK